MEGLKFGWKKSTKFYHYYDANDIYSVCGIASYLSVPDKRLVFLDEIEITPEMVICKRCYDIRAEQIKRKIKSVNKEHWDGSRVCPNCKTPVIFWNSGQKKEHPCTVCNKMVVLQ